MNKEKELIDKLIDLAFAEDIGDGDHTTLSCIPATAMGKSKLLIKEAGVLAGIEVAKEIFNRFDPTMKVEVFINDGAEVKPGDVAMIAQHLCRILLTVIFRYHPQRGGTAVHLVELLIMGKGLKKTHFL